MCLHFAGPGDMLVPTREGRANLTPIVYALLGASFLLMTYFPGPGKLSCAKNSIDLHY
jgi:hypothetical protein